MLATWAGFIVAAGEDCVAFVTGPADSNARLAPDALESWICWLWLCDVAGVAGALWEFWEFASVNSQYVVGKHRCWAQLTGREGSSGSAGARSSHIPWNGP